MLSKVYWLMTIHWLMRLPIQNNLRSDGMKVLMFGTRPYHASPLTDAEWEILPASSRGIKQAEKYGWVCDCPDSWVAIAELRSDILRSASSAYDSLADELDQSDGVDGFCDFDVKHWTESITHRV
jgi:hypothetical protein